MISQCLACRYFIPTEKFTCFAFPAGIPAEVFENRHDHTRPYLGDNGIRYEPIKDDNDNQPNRPDRENRRGDSSA